MQNEHFLRDANGNVLAVVTLTVAAIFGTIGLAISDDSLDATQWSAVSMAHAIAVAPDAKNAVTRKDAADPRATVNWDADESARGTPPDAAH
ncbi:MAG: hypothetical protein ACR2GP_06310 [Burkholderiaceae bacterium]